MKDEDFMMSVRLTQEQKAALDRYCKQEDRTRAGSVRRFIRLALKEWEAEIESLRKEVK